LLIIPDPTTPLEGEMIMVDDSHPDVLFEGFGWGKVVYERDSALDFQVVSFQNATQHTDTLGDSMKFSFTGQYTRLSSPQTVFIFLIRHIPPNIWHSAQWQYLTFLCY
jgi:hypothetical protein